MLRLRANDLLTGLVRAGIPGPHGEGPAEWRCSSLPSIRAGPKFGSDTEQSRQRRRLETARPGEEIDLVVKPCIARGIGTRLALEDDLIGRCGMMQARPDQEHA